MSMQRKFKPDINGCEKVCRDCGETKNCAQFYPSASGGGRRINSCDVCRAAQVKGYRARLREGQPRLRAEREWSGDFGTTEREKKAWSAHRVTRDQYRAMLEAQEGRCPICGCELASLDPRHVHIDHDRQCCPRVRSCGSCTREILCNQCNLALGHLKDSTSSARSLLNYLQKWK